MKTLAILIKRDVKLFFRDKGTFFTSLITPAILLALYATFLGNVYRDGFLAGLPAGMSVSDDIIDGLVGGQLASSVLSAACVTVAFCSNFLMVQDKAGGAIRDLTIAPVRPAVLALGYYVATIVSTLIICFAATGVCLAYVYAVEWYVSAGDAALLFLDVFMLVLFGVALSSVINFFLSTQGQISAVGAVISAGYGFICGAYMPIATFSDGLQKVLSFLPGTYATSLIRNHALRGALSAMEAEGVPAQAIESIRDSLDCNIYFDGRLVGESQKYLLLASAIVVLAITYVLLNVLGRRARR